MAQTTKPTPHGVRLRWRRWATARAWIVLICLLLAALLWRNVAELTAGLLTLSAQSAQQAGHLSQALSQLRTAQVLAPELPHAASQEVYLRATQTQPNAEGDDEAMSHLQKATTSFAPAYNNRAVVAAAQGRPDEALALLTEAVRLNPGSAQAQFNLGVVAQRLGKVQIAEQALRQATLSAPDWEDAHLHLAVLYLEMNKFGRAESAARAAVRLDATRPETHQALVNALFHQDKTTEGLAATEAALTRFPADPTLLLYRGLFLRAQTENDQALDVLRTSFFAADDEALRRRVAEEILSILKQ